MGRLLHEVARELLVVAKVVFRDESSLTSTLLIFGEHENPQNVVFSCVAELCGNLSVGIKAKGRLERVRLIEPIGKSFEFEHGLKTTRGVST